MALANQVHRNILAGVLACVSVACKSHNSDVSSTNGLNYSHESTTLPLTWRVSGNTNKNCVDNSLLVPPELVEAINVAWTEADKLLKVPLSRMMIKSAVLDAPPADMPPEKLMAGKFRLASVDVLVGSESVLYMSGCINAKPKEVAGENEAARQEYESRKATVNKGGEDLVDACGQVSESIQFLKSIILSPKSDSNCSPEMVAGFALRSSNREIVLSANFLIDGRTFTKSSDPFDINRIEVAANASASISTFAAAILPLPPPIKAASAALLDRIGSASFSAQLGHTKTLIPDRSYTKANYPDEDHGAEGNKGMMRVSKLAIKIAKDILRPICREAMPIVGGSKNVESCDLRPLQTYPGTLEALNRYREIPVVRCLAGATPAEDMYFALAPRPDVAAKEIDFLVTGSNPTKLSVYQKQNDTVSALNYLTWSTYQGENRTAICGPVPDGKRCIAVKVGKGLLGLMQGRCEAINSKKIDLKLSLATDRTMQPL